MKKSKQITLSQARLIGDCLYLDWEQVDLEQFRQGLMGYHRTVGSHAASEFPGMLRAGRAVLAHMQQFPDYSVRIARLRAEACANSSRKKAILRPHSAS